MCEIMTRYLLPQKKSLVAAKSLGRELPPWYPGSGSALKESSAKFAPWVDGQNGHQIHRHRHDMTSGFPSCGSFWLWQAPGVELVDWIRHSRCNSTTCWNNFKHLYLNLMKSYYINLIQLGMKQFFFNSRDWVVRGRSCFCQSLLICFSIRNLLRCACRPDRIARSSTTKVSFGESIFILVRMQSYS